MRKLITFTAAGLMLSAALLVIGCRQAALPVQDAKTDTVITLGAPNVKAIAYPGFNYVTWGPVTSAKGYVLYRYDGNGWDRAATLNSTTLFFEDVAVVGGSTHVIRNGVKYRYKVEAESKTDKGRAVIAMNNMGESNEVTAIVPPANTNVLMLAAYEGGWDGKKEKTEKDIAKKEFQLDASKLKTAYRKGKFVVEFPTKAYLKYDIVIKPDYYFDALNNHEYDIGVGDIAYTYNDVNAQNNIVVLEPIARDPGTFKVMVRVSARKGSYEYTDVVGDKLTVPELEESKPAVALYAKYLDPKKVRFAWKPAKDFESQYVPTAEYKVYRQNQSSMLYEVLSAEVKEDTQVAKNEKVYYIEDEIAEGKNDLSYKYFAVHTKDSKFAKVRADITLAAYTPFGGQSAAAFDSVVLDKLDGDNKANDLRITVKDIEVGTTIAVSYAKVEKAITGVTEATLGSLLSKFAAVEMKKDEGLGQRYMTGYLKNLEDGHYVLRLLSTKAGGQDKITLYSNSIEVKTGTTIGDLSGTLPALTWTVACVDKDGDKNDFAFKVAYGAADKEIKLVKVQYAFVGDKNPGAVNENTVLASEWKDVEMKDNTPAPDKFGTVKDLAHGWYIVRMLLQNKDATQEKYAYAPSALESAILFTDITSVKATQVKTDAGVYTRDVRVEVKDMVATGDALNKYDYKLRYTKIDTKLFGTSYAFADVAKWSTPADVTMRHEDATNVSGVFAKDSLEDGTYVFEVTKTHKTSKKTSVKTATLTVNLNPMYSLSGMFVRAEAKYAATFKIGSGADTNYFTKFDTNGTEVEAKLTVMKGGMPVGKDTLKKDDVKAVYRVALQKSTPSYIEAIDVANAVSTFNVSNNDFYKVVDTTAKVGNGYTYFVCFKPADGEELWTSYTVSPMDYSSSDPTQADYRHPEKANDGKKGANTVGNSANSNGTYNWITGTALPLVTWGTAGDYNDKTFSLNSGSWTGKISVKVEN